MRRVEVEAVVRPQSHSARNVVVWSWPLLVPVVETSAAVNTPIIQTQLHSNQRI